MKLYNKHGAEITPRKIIREIFYEILVYLQTSVIETTHESRVQLTDLPDVDEEYTLWSYDVKICYLFKARLNLIVNITSYNNPIGVSMQGRYVSSRQMFILILGSDAHLRDVFN